MLSVEDKEVGPNRTRARMVTKRMLVNQSMLQPTQQIVKQHTRVLMDLNALSAAVTS
jgi:hypothetical protein